MAAAGRARLAALSTNAAYDMKFFAFPLLLLATPLSAGAAEPRIADVPPQFGHLVPRQFDKGLTLVEIKRINPGVSRDVEVGTAEAPKSVQVSVKDGVRAMYAYPNERFYANVKIEISREGMFASDSATARKALFAMADRMRESASRANAPGMAEAAEAAKAAGFELLESGKDSYREIDYSFVLSHTGDGQGQVHVFVPKHEAIISIYLLGRAAAGGSVADTRTAQLAFVRNYIAALK